MPVVTNEIRHSYLRFFDAFQSYTSRQGLPFRHHSLQQSFRRPCSVSTYHRTLHTTCLRYDANKEAAQQEVLSSFKKTLGRKKVTYESPNLWNHAFTKSESSVRLFGYLGERSDLSKRLSFVVLKDPQQNRQIQLVSAPSMNNQEELDIHEDFKTIKAHSPVYVEGYLRPKKLKPDDDKILGEKDISRLELLISGPSTKIESLNDFPSDITLKPETEFSPEQRNLQLRNDSYLRSTLALRANIKHKCSAFLRETVQAVEIETPLLFKSTSEGAREFLVPTRRSGYAYALPQSPQQFKQLLMASGIHRYYQFAKCFRDEDLRADRQPEFTQLDIEMSFASGEDVMRAVERDIVLPLWKAILSVDLPSTFRRISYNEAMSQYGSDKPDLRIPVRPFTPVAHVIPADLASMISGLIDPLIDAMVVPLESTVRETRAFVKSFFDSAAGKAANDNAEGGPGVFIYDSGRPLHGLSAFGFEAVETLERDLDLEDGYLIILQARKRAPHSGGSTPLGNMRKDIFNAAVREGLLLAPSWKKFEPLWVTDFPLFSPIEASAPGQGGNAGFASTHHPFTSPKSPDDVDMLLTDPTKATGDHYDLVINGEEIGGGSRRIHQAAMQDFIFREILNMDVDKVKEFNHLLEALRAGCPPHAGIALGFDRLVAMLASSRFEKKMNMRDVIAFPKSGKGDDPTVKSPGVLTNEALETYHLKLRGD